MQVIVKRAFTHRECDIFVRASSLTEADVPLILHIPTKRSLSNLQALSKK